MRKCEYMIYNFSKSIVFVFVILLFLINTDLVFAESDSINVKLISFENTSIVEFTNNGTESINAFKFWLVDDSFLSFKTEYGWTGEKNNQGTLIFSSVTPFESGQKVKFGVKTNSDTPINWNALGINGTSLEINTTLSIVDESVSDITDNGFLPNSTFKVIPELSRISSPVRIAGTDFAANQTFNLFMNTKLITSFSTDASGDFVFTEIIPETFEPGMITYRIQDLYGHNRYLTSHMLESTETLLAKESLTVNDFSELYSIGDTISFSGKTEPETKVSIKISDPSDLSWSENHTISDNLGNWLLDFEVHEKSLFGTYAVEINSLDSSITNQLKILLTNQIDIASSKPSFYQNDIVSFNGHGNSGNAIQVFILNSNGEHVNSFEYTIPKTGLIEIKYAYDYFVSGDTYFLYAFQGDTVDVISFGIGEYPKNTLSSKLNKINYFSDDTAFVAIHGAPFDELFLIISDDSGNSIFEEKIILGIEGKSTRPIDLTNLNSDYYSLVITKGNMKTTENFTVDFPIGFHFVDYSFTKEFYYPHDFVSLHGHTSPKIPMNFTLYDLKSKALDKFESFSNADGDFVIDNFKIPTTRLNGEWMIQIQSGTNSKNTFFNVDSNDSFVVLISEIQKTPYGRLVLIDGKNASPENPVSIFIRNSNSSEIWELSTKSTKDGDFSILWSVPKDAPSGEYIIGARDSDSKFSNLFFDIEFN